MLVYLFKDRALIVLGYGLLHLQDFVLLHSFLRPQYTFGFWRCCTSSHICSPTLIVLLSMMNDEDDMENVHHTENHWRGYKRRNSLGLRALLCWGCLIPDQLPLIDMLIFGAKSGRDTLNLVELVEFHFYSANQSVLPMTFWLPYAYLCWGKTGNRPWSPQTSASKR